jgi:hypothetical protein
MYKLVSTAQVSDSADGGSDDIPWCRGVDGVGLGLLGSIT